MQDVDVVVIGAGAAGIAAAACLIDAGLSVQVVEARSRAGGRAWTVNAGGFALDLGCGWLHSADENEWTTIAEKTGFAIDRTPPPWGTQAFDLAFPPADQEAFHDAFGAFYERLDEAEGPVDRPAADLLAPGGRWNHLLDAISTWVNGAELSRLSVEDYRNYADTGVNWRVPDGYGAAIVAHVDMLPVAFDCPVTRIDHKGADVVVETTQGAIRAAAVVVTVPTNVLAEGGIAFDPPLPDKIEAAAALPLGLADKLYLRLTGPDGFADDSHLFGNPGGGSTRMASFHLRPFGRPLVEAYFGGAFARELEAEGEAAFAAQAIDELAGLVGNDIRARITPVAASAWGRDPFARGSYSHALPGKAAARAALAEPVDGRIFFAGEACSRHDYSTAHGAYRTGIAAADGLVASLRRSR